MRRNLETPIKLRVPLSESCQDTELNKALMISKDMYNRCIDYTTENARLAEIAEQQASKLVKLKAASHEMTKDWNDALRNIQRKRREELVWKRDRTEKSMLKFVKDMNERNTVQQAKIVKEARQLLFQKQPHCRIINSALLTSETYRELNAQLAFRQKLENLDKQRDNAYADLLKNDTEKFFEEKEQKAKERLEKTRIYAALLKKQIENTSNNLKNIELIEARADAEDLDNMQKEEKMIKQCETEQMLEEKKKWKQIFLNQLEEKKSLEKKMEQEENIQNSYIAACRSAKEHASKITKMKRKEAHDNKIAYCEKIAKKCAIVYQTDEAAEDERIQRALAAKDELEKARGERDRQFRDKMQNDIKRYAAEAAALKEKHKREEKNLIEWETKQRYKRDAYNKEMEMKIAMEEKRKKEEMAKYLRKQVVDRKNLEEKDRIMDDDSERVKEVIQNTNERILTYGQQVLKESEGVRPLFPIIKVIEARQLHIYYVNDGEVKTSNNFSMKIFVMTESKGNATSPPVKPKTLPPAINFLNGGLSGMAATCVVHPMDVIKNRMQMSKEKIPISKTVSLIRESGGITKFYAGLSAGLLRQATYTTARLGIYNQLTDMWRAKNEGAPSFLTSVVMGMTAGASGAFIGTPTEVALVRMTSDGRLPLDQRRNYKNVIDAFMRIIKEEGLTTLWRGSVATMGRAAVVNASQLATYSQAKILLSSKAGIPDGIPLHFCASMISGFLTAFNSMPFDIAKTRIQNSSTKEKKVPGVLTVIMTIAKSEGAGALWKGFWPTYCRIGPHTVITFIFNEQFAQFYRTVVMK